MYVRSWKPVRKPKVERVCCCCGCPLMPDRFRMDVNLKSDEMRHPVKVGCCWMCMKAGLVRRGFAMMPTENVPPEFERCREMIRKAMGELSRIWNANRDREKQMSAAVKLRHGLASEVNRAGAKVWDGEMTAGQFRAVLAEWFKAVRDDWRTKPEDWAERKKAIKREVSDG